MLEIEAYGPASYLHIKNKFVSETGVKYGIKPSYSLRLAIDKHGKTHETLVAEAKRLGVTPNTETLRYYDGDEITLQDGTQPYSGMYLIELSTRWPISIVDAKGNDMQLEAEPGSGTMVNAAFKIGANKNNDRLNYFLTGVQIVELKKNENTPHKFGEFKQAEFDGLNVKEPEF